MPKLKKPPKNAYYFFVTTRKEEAEREGYRVNGGFQAMSQMFGGEWSHMTKEDKLPFEQLAKEAKEHEKYNANNKFTVTGESYAQLNQKSLDLKAHQEEMEHFMQDITSATNAVECHYVLMKVVYSIEEIISKKSKMYWPSEISLAAFSLKGGLKSVYTQLIDTINVPTGYASQAKENCSESLLPLPGDKEIFGDDCRDYSTIIKNICGFLNHWLRDGYNIPGHKRVIFCLEPEIEPIKGCLQWLINTLSGTDKEKYQGFLDNLKVYKLPKLILYMAEDANRTDPKYDNYLVRFKLEAAAEEIVNKGNYDYREEIACWYHRSELASMKMVNCAQSVVMRRVYMLFEEFLLPYELPRTDRHRVDKLKRQPRGPLLKKKRSEPPKEVIVTEPSWMKDDAPQDLNLNLLTEESKHSHINSNHVAKRKADSKHGEYSQCSNTPLAAFDATVKRIRLNDQMECESSDGAGSAEQEPARNPWDRQRPATVPTLVDEDFPGLGEPKSPRGRGSSSSGKSTLQSQGPSQFLPKTYAGVGRGAAARPAAPSSPKSFMDAGEEDISSDDDDPFPTLQAANPGLGRGRARGREQQ